MARFSWNIRLCRLCTWINVTDRNKSVHLRFHLKTKCNSTPPTMWSDPELPKSHSCNSVSLPVADKPLCLHSCCFSKYDITCGPNAAVILGQGPTSGIALSPLLPWQNPSSGRASSLPIPQQSPTLMRASSPAIPQQSPASGRASSMAIPCQSPASGRVLTSSISQQSPVLWRTFPAI